MQKNKNMRVMDGNEAVAHASYKVSELIVLYPITPSTPMGELGDEWASKGVKNIWGNVPNVIEMQSEGGAAGALHGAIQTGALATTYTASQGLLLMIPNMYKIAGELTPVVIHVATRSLATHALSIFNDYSDIMATRSTGWVMLVSGSVQEAQDNALIAHAATLAGRIPCLHVFDGFRISHEINKIETLSDEEIRMLIDDELVIAHRGRALNPDNPSIRGTAQNPDVFFQSRECSNPFYQMMPNIVAEYMQKFATLTGRKYNLVDYYGVHDAEQVMIIMGSGAITARETVKYLQKSGAKIGILQIRLFRPFPAKQMIAALPKNVKIIAVLDRTKEPGTLGEPLYQDVVSALNEARFDDESLFKNGLPKVIGGRYGLGSKEFTPAMVKAVFDEFKKPSLKHHFTIGINDDVTHLSIDYDTKFEIPMENMVQAIFFGLGSDGTVSANKNSIKIIGEDAELYAQGYFVYDSKKAGSQTISHLRFGAEPIQAPYLINTADFIACHHFPFVTKYNVLEKAKVGATFLLNSPYSADTVWEKLPCPLQETLIEKKLKFYVIDAIEVARNTGMGVRINTIMQTCFFALAKVLPRDEAISRIKVAIEKTYKHKGEETIAKNYAAVDITLGNLKQVKVPKRVSPDACPLPRTVSIKAPDFVQNITAAMMANRGDELPVSVLPIDGTYPSGTTKWEKRNISDLVANWNPDLCVQCGHCSFVCPHSVIRAKHFLTTLLANAPSEFKSAKLLDKKFGEERSYSLQVYLEDCTGCNLCNIVCPGISKTDSKEKAIKLKAKEPILETERKNIEFFETLPLNERSEIDILIPRQVQYLEPLFEFSGACAGCGETPYIRIITQLFGDRMLVANATGCSSIYGGNLPTTPWTYNRENRGPAWSNSLFEDNAEFGLGFRLAMDAARRQALMLLQNMQKILGEDLVKSIIQGIDNQDEKGIIEQRERLRVLKAKLQKSTDKKALTLSSLADHLIERSVWIIGGDGWAYDIDFGGLDHVLASGDKVNLLVLDTGVYSNTGGQASKSTPRSAVAKFAASGKTRAHKDLGLMMMSYGNIYIAQIAFGANHRQTLQALIEAENYPGPSLILAYSQCIAHGIDMQKGIEQQKLAVACGYWPLYRYDPQRKAQNLNPLQLDSADPTIPFKDYAYNEQRFAVLAKNHPKLAEELLQEAQNDIDENWQLYKKLAQ